MKLKGIHPIEQHIEKLVVGLFAIALLAVLAWQFLGPPNTVKIGQTEVTLDKATDEVARKAADAKARATTERPPLPTGVEAVAVGEQFEGRFRGPVAPARELAAALDNTATPLAGGSEALPVGELTLAPVQLPPPSAPVAGLYAATIDPREVADHRELAAHVPAQLPFDKAWVTVEATFDGAALKRALAGDPDAEGPAQPLPRYWWDGGTGVQILGVQLERQELQPDGSWGKPAPVAPLPGRYAVELAARKPVTAAELATKVRDAAANAQDIRRPDFYALVMGEPWVPPSERGTAAAGPNRAEIERAQAQIGRLDDEIAKLEGELSQAGNEPAQQRRRELLQRRLDEKKRERDRLQQTIAGPETGAAAPSPDADPAAAERATREAAAVIDNPAIRVWAHDITAERGRTYQYRLAVVLNNPIFGREAALKPDQAELAKAPTLISPASPWTEPVRVFDETYYFIVNAEEGGGLTGVPSASAEVYVFSWGYWRRGMIGLQPGDPLAGEIRVPDLSGLIAAVPTSTDPTTPPRGPESRLPGSGVPPAETLERPRPQAPSPNPAPGPAEGAPQRVPMKQVAVSKDVYLLDVVPNPNRGSGAGGGQAFMRNSDGRIEPKDPQAEKSSPEYLLVSRSAARGEDEIRPRQERRQRPRSDERERDRPEAGPREGKGRGPGGGGG
ncbi:MAG TPA: hypothetical protein VD963_05940 [Phycisphaerales bacterium]|nr:hypothetical protein [Phycisphaerales bacterium]